MAKSRATRMIIQSVSKEQLQKMVPKWFMLLFPLAFLVEYTSIQWFSTIFFVSSKLLCLLWLEHLLLCYFVQMDVRIELPEAFCQGAQSCHVTEKIPWRRKWQPTPVLLPGKSEEQRSLAGYSKWGHKESDTTEPLSMHTCMLKKGPFLGHEVPWFRESIDGVCFQKEFHRSWLEIISLPRRGFVAMCDHRSVTESCPDQELHDYFDGPISKL